MSTYDGEWIAALQACLRSAEAANDAKAVQEIKEDIDHALDNWGQPVGTSKT